MGRPFSEEISKFPATYRRALKVDVSSLERFIEAASTGPLVCVGSGGALTAAHSACVMHQKIFWQLAKAVTPLDFASQPTLKDCSILIISSGGENKDILRALESAERKDYRNIGVLCASPSSSLARRAKLRGHHAAVFSSTFGKEGFLATNSLVLFTTVLARAYGHKESNSDLSLNLSDTSSRSFKQAVQKLASGFFSKKSLVVISDSSTMSAAVDIESKLCESGISSVQLADIRNFAHGRHNWVAKNLGSTGIVLVCSNESLPLGEKTLSLLPEDVPKFVFVIAGSLGSVQVQCVHFSSFLTDVFGRSSGIDPGRPGVPQYGSRIYRLSPGPLSSPNLLDVCIRRKLNGAPVFLPDASQKEWHKSLTEFWERIREITFSSIVLDYDGTLSTRPRSGVETGVASQLTRLLAADTEIGIATGRGDSVHAELRAALPRRYWSRVLVGYHNGAEVRRLNKPAPILEKESPVILKACAVLEPFQRTHLFRMKPSSSQIRVIPTSSLPISMLFPFLESKLAPLEVKLAKSGHSIDIVQVGVSKLQVVETLDTRNPVLCIGDRGSETGNDFELLTSQYSLSVDEVSSDPLSCWNLLPPGIRGVPGTEFYLDKLSKVKRGVSFSGFRFLEMKL